MSVIIGSIVTMERERGKRGTRATRIRTAAAVAVACVNNERSFNILTYQSRSLPCVPHATRVPPPRVSARRAAIDESQNQSSTRCACLVCLVEGLPPASSGWAKGSLPHGWSHQVRRLLGPAGLPGLRASQRPRGPGAAKKHDGAVVLGSSSSFSAVHEHDRLTWRGWPVKFVSTVARSVCSAGWQLYGLAYGVRLAGSDLAGSGLAAKSGGRAGGIDATEALEA